MEADSFAAKSRTEIVTALAIEQAGAQWDRARVAWVFKDGSAGAFTKHATLINLGGVDKNATLKFSNYRFEVEP